MTRGELVDELAATLGARHEARYIVEEVLGTTPSSRDRAVGPADTDAVRSLADRRSRGEPLQYVLGHWAFRLLDLLLDPRVLIPRPETEQLVEVALHEVGELGVARPLIVDAGTGSGAIALSLASELARPYPGGHLWAVDESPEALAVAAANLERVRRLHQGRLLPVTLLEGSWLSALPGALQGRVTMVVANPPYVAISEWPVLPTDVQREPVGALLAEAGSDGTPGLGAVEEVLRQAVHWLTRPGVVVIELAPHQAEAAVTMAQSFGYQDVRVEADLSRRPRSLVGRIR
jgi:release factor glutamine methyltransferase